MPTTSGGPILAGPNVIYKGAGGAVGGYYALNRATGKLDWSSGITSTHSFAVAAHGNRIFLATYGGLGVTAMNATTGRVVWEHHLVQVGFFSYDTLLYHGGLLYTDSRFVFNAKTGRLYGLLGTSLHSGFILKHDHFFTLTHVSSSNVRSNTLLAIFLQTRALYPGLDAYPIWSAPPPAGTHDGYIDELAASRRAVVAYYSYSHSYRKSHHLNPYLGIVQVRNAGNGHLMWQRKTTSFASFGISHRMVFMVSHPGLKDRKRKGPEQTRVSAYSWKSGKRLWSSLVIRGGSGGFRIYAAGNEVLVPILSEYHNSQQYHGSLYALQRRTGRLLWSFSFPAHRKSRTGKAR